MKFIYVCWRVTYSIDFNNLPNNKTCDNSTYKIIDLSNVDQEVVCFEPFIGQCFLSEKKTFGFYENYTKISGFSIRKGRFIKKRDDT